MFYEKQLFYEIGLEHMDAIMWKTFGTLHVCSS